MRCAICEPRVELSADMIGARPPAHRANAGRSMTPLIDTFGRLHDNLRISVTDRCNIRCFYCMPETGVKFQPREQILSFEEIERFVRIAVVAGRPQAAHHRRRAAGAQRSVATLVAKAGGDRGHRGSGADHQRRAAGRTGPGALRRRAAAHQRPSGHARSRALQADHPPRRSRQSARRHRDCAAKSASAPSRSTPSR